MTFSKVFSSLKTASERIAEEGNIVRANQDQITQLIQIAQDMGEITIDERMKLMRILLRQQEPDYFSSDAA